ncbi:MAG: formate--tetrahydrofolate ligase, partial [Bacteroidota bacterium]
MTDQEIARQATLLPIDRIAERLGIPSADLEHYGKYKAKIPLEYTKGGGDQPRVEQARGRLVLVSAISPTPAGEGKTTCTLGLLDGLN